MNWTRNLSSFLKSEHETMSNEQGTMNNGKNCLDCLHCKVSAKTKEVRLCFCARTKKKENHREPYWIDKPVCKRFDDMSA